LIYLGDEGAEALRHADVVVEQMFDSSTQIRASNVRPGAKWFRFPLVYGLFLWPYSTQAHVQNQSYPFLPSGPYPDEFGDRFLNRMIGRVPFEEAINKYMDLDVPAHANLDRLYELNMASQRERDQLSGIDVATLIEQNFRNEPLFVSKGHPTKRLFDHIATTLFRNMGVPEDEIRLATGSYVRSTLQRDELPVHHGVIAHYGLTYLTKDSTYRYLQEGKITFKQYISRYFLYDWNPELHEGAYLAIHSDQAPEDVLALLERGLARSPQSDMGWRAMSHLLVRLGRLGEARYAGRRAVIADSENPENHGCLASVLVRMDNLAKAEETLRTALEIHPLGTKFHQALADVLSRSGRPQDAVEYAVPLSPGDPNVYSLLDRVRSRNSDLDGAEQAYGQAIALAPEAESFPLGLSQVLAQKNTA
jgi:Flp pilus assembly protein TadD